MLVLNRKLGESIRVGHDVEIVVVRIERSQVRLGVSAPREIPIHRNEVYDTIWGRIGREEKP